MGIFTDRAAEVRDHALAATERDRSVFTVRTAYKPDRGVDGKLDQLITAVEAGTAWQLHNIIPLGSGDQLLLLFRPDTSIRRQ